MQIKPILARLQSAIGRQDLIDQMVLVPERSKATKSRKTVSFVVGYNGSCNSQTALDMTLWIAHQTRLATQKQVTVHVVYVLDRPVRSTFSHLSGRSPAATAERTACLPRFVESDCVIPNFQAIDPFDHADYVLWQARCMAEEWRGSLEAHLRFGNPAEQLRQVIEAEEADLLLLGCTSARHPIVTQLASLPCPVLGIPHQTHPEEGAIASPVGSELRAY